MELEHYGILGMKWGIRRSPEQLGHKYLPKGVRMYKDGKIEIDKGVNIQRISREKGLNPMHRTYASITKYDGLRYIADYGKDDGRDYILEMRTKEKLVAPTTDVHWIEKLQNSFLSKLTARGYNALLDENDFSRSSIVAPIIVFDPHKSLEVTGITEITDKLKSATWEELLQYESTGDLIIEKLFSMRK